MNTQGVEENFFEKFGQKFSKLIRSRFNGRKIFRLVARW